MSNLSSSPPIARDGGSFKSTLALLFSVLALLVACGTFAYQHYRNPLGKGVEAYDFRTPQAALISDLEMEANADVLAAMQRQQRISAKKLTEKKQSMKIDRERTYQDYKLLFISYDKAGKKQHEVVAYEQDKDTGWWTLAYLTRFDMEDEELRQEIEDWEAQAALAPDEASPKEELPEE